MRRILNPSSFIFYFCYPNPAAARSPIRHPFRSASSLLKTGQNLTGLARVINPLVRIYTLTLVHDARALFAAALNVQGFVLGGAFPIF
jgi:hypothetical protein